MAEAVGILEVYGLVTAFCAADAGCKAANVHLEVFDKNKPANADALPVPLLVCIKYRGSVADVEAAMEAGMQKAESVTAGVFSTLQSLPSALWRSTISYTTISSISLCPLISSA